MQSENVLLERWDVSMSSGSTKHSVPSEFPHLLKHGGEFTRAAAFAALVSLEEHAVDVLSAVPGQVVFMNKILSRVVDDVSRQDWTETVHFAVVLIAVGRLRRLAAICVPEQRGCSPSSDSWYRRCASLLSKAFSALFCVVPMTLSFEEFRWFQTRCSFRKQTASRAHKCGSQGTQRRKIGQSPTKHRTSNLKHGFHENEPAERRWKKQQMDTKHADWSYIHQHYNTHCPGWLSSRDAHANEGIVWPLTARPGLSEAIPNGSQAFMKAWARAPSVAGSSSALRTSTPPLTNHKQNASWNQLTIQVAGWDHGRMRNRRTSTPREKLRLGKTFCCKSTPWNRPTRLAVWINHEMFSALPQFPRPYQRHADAAGRQLCDSCAHFPTCELEHPFYLWTWPFRAR